MGSSQTQEHYTVVINAEEQYSIWPTFKKVPAGWKEVGFQGLKDSCLAYIQEIWKDMRPLSLRKKIAERKGEWEEQKRKLLQSPAQKPAQSALVTFLSQGVHPITTGPTNKNCRELKESLDRRHVHLTFQDTQGTTCIGIKLDIEKSVYNPEDLDREQGNLHIEGTLVLDFVPVRCVVDLQLPSLDGNGFLIVL